VPKANVGTVLNLHMMQNAKYMPMKIYANAKVIFSQVQAK
jgi:hypothetical protein